MDTLVNVYLCELVCISVCMVCVHMPACLSFSVCKGQFGSGLFLGEVTFACIEDRNSLRQPKVEFPGKTHTRAHTYGSLHCTERKAHAVPQTTHNSLDLRIKRKGGLTTQTDKKTAAWHRGHTNTRLACTKTHT